MLTTRLAIKKLYVSFWCPQEAHNKIEIEPFTNSAMMSSRWSESFTTRTNSPIVVLVFTFSRVQVGEIEPGLRQRNSARVQENCF